MTLPTGNVIIDTMCAYEESRVFRHAKVVTLERSHATTIRDRTMRTVDFPTTALMSVVGSLEDGATSEIASVGIEAFVEIDAALRSTVAKRSALCLFGGDVIRVPMADFQDTLASSELFADLIYHAVRARVFVTEQIEMCNAKHSVIQRLSRWFLLAAMRMNRGDFAITHEHLGVILGVRRASVSSATADLERDGALTTARNAIAIDDHVRLQERACECFALCATAIEDSGAAWRGSI